MLVAFPFLDAGFHDGHLDGFGVWARERVIFSVTKKVHFIHEHVENECQKLMCIMLNQASTKPRCGLLKRRKLLSVKSIDVILEVIRNRYDALEEHNLPRKFSASPNHNFRSIKSSVSSRDFSSVTEEGCLQLRHFSSAAVDSSDNDIHQ